MATSLGDQIRSSFERINQRVTDPLVMTKCIEICTMHSLSADQLANHWESFIIRNPSVQSPSAVAFDRFRSEVLSKLPRNAAVSVASTRAVQPIVRSALESPASAEGLSPALFGRYGIAAPALPSTPSQHSSSSAASTPHARLSAPLSAHVKPELLAMRSPATPGAASSNGVSPITPDTDHYVRRKGARDVKVSFNEQLANFIVVKSSDSVKKAISVQTVMPLSSYKYMWDPLPGRAEAFRERVNRLGNFILSKHEDKLPHEPTSFHLATSEDILCFGKICCEGSGTADEKLDARSVLLEGQSPESEVLFRVKLDLRQLRSYSLFPGEVVGLRGLNPTGNSLVVKELVCDASLPVAVTDDASVYEDGLVRVVVAAGPFCSHENLDYRPLQDLMEVALGSADVLVLMGPFVDATHKHVADGNMDCTFDELWQHVIDTHILRRVEAHNSTAARGKMVQKVVLIPALTDLHHHPVFPQFSFSLEVSYLKDLIVCAPNPAMLRINGVLVGLTSTDPLKHMANASLLQHPADDPQYSRIKELASLLIEQQSFLPLNPSPLEVNLDTRNLSNTEFGEETPQILIIPSVLKEFVEPIKNCLVVNPSFLIRGGSGGGTFAEITFFPKSQSSEDAGGVVPMDVDQTGATPASSSSFDVMKRVGVKIIKI